MDSQHEKRLNQLMLRIVDVKEELARLEEDELGRTPQQLSACRKTIDEIGTQYRAIRAEVSDREREQIERRYGRKVIDLRRDAAWLPEHSHGDAVPLSTRSQWQTAWDDPLPPEPEPTELPPPMPKPRSRGPRVGGEIDAWCGSCKGLRMHTIVAMVGDEPKQVICLSCNAKHGFRLTPARGKPGGAAKKKRGKLTPDEAKRMREEEERAAFQKELLEAADVRPFEKRVRYRAGQYIEHPEHGRGKIESVVKGSLLVRFRGGLRPISLV